MFGLEGIIGRIPKFWRMRTVLVTSPDFSVVPGCERNSYRGILKGLTENAD
jgi:hypothetical protein